MRSFRALPLVLAGLFALGCTHRFEAKAVQPNPLRTPAETLRRSERLFIDVKDMELPRSFILRNSAYFAVISRDRLRFHVIVIHKWEEFADPRGWDVWLEDDRGRVFRPEAKEVRGNNHVTRMWDYDVRVPIRNLYGDIVAAPPDGHRRGRYPLASVDVFKGEGDYVFYARDLFHPDLERLALVMRRGGIEYRYEWRFRDDVVQVEHHDQGLPDQTGDLLQGPITGNQ